MDPQQPQPALGRPDIKDPPPSYSKAGYTALPQSEPAYYSNYGGQSEAAYHYGPSSTGYPPAGYAGYQHSAGYAPVPPVMQQNSVNTVSGS